MIQDPVDYLLCDSRGGGRLGFPGDGTLCSRIHRGRGEWTPLHAWRPHQTTGFAIVAKIGSNYHFSGCTISDVPVYLFVTNRISDKSVLEVGGLSPRRIIRANSGSYIRPAIENYCAVCLFCV